MKEKSHWSHHTQSRCLQISIDSSFSVKLPHSRQVWGLCSLFGFFGDTGSLGGSAVDKTFLIQPRQRRRWQHTLQHLAMVTRMSESATKGFSTITFLSWPRSQRKLCCSASLVAHERDTITFTVCSRFSNPAARWSRLRCPLVLLPQSIVPKITGHTCIHPQHRYGYNS